MTIKRDDIREPAMTAGELIEGLKSLLNRYSNENDVGVSVVNVDCVDISTISKKSFAYKIHIEFTK
jgi:hypothetical protein